MKSKVFPNQPTQKDCSQWKEEMQKILISKEWKEHAAYLAKPHIS